MIETLEQLQQEFDKVPRFRDDKGTTWFAACYVLRLLGLFETFCSECIKLLSDVDCMRIPYDNILSRSHLYQIIVPGFENKCNGCDVWISTYAVSSLTERARLPFPVTFQYWKYTCMLHTTPQPVDFVLKDTVFENTVPPPPPSTPTEEEDDSDDTDIYYEREVTKRMKFDKRFEYTMLKLKLEHEYNVLKLEKNTMTK